MKRFENEKWKIVLTSLLTLSPLFIGLILWRKLPEQIPTHFNYLVQADQYSSKAFAVFVPSLFLFLLHLLCLFVTGKDPDNKNVSDKIMNLVIWICPLISFYLSFIMYGNVNGSKIPAVKASAILVGAMFVFIGNYMPKCRYNHTVGIRLPWTLKDVEVWDKTHRFGGYTMLTAGMVSLFSVFFDERITSLLLLIDLLFVALIPAIYSYLLYRKKHNQQ